MIEIADFFQKYWTIVIFLGGLVASWVYLKYEQSQAIKDITALKEAGESDRVNIADVKDRIGNIETAVDFIKNDMNYIKNMFVKILEKK